ncbi:hypothetical protein EYF80_037664 [Liparis tanakae]|uniref:Uncharacterized protein n=1 Tax=Liparis tanakae TaxID=230148 RepID=A0A4Z2GG47_9TELE|nr:hypothetical protein EYF80_037664 [Liparis tanakae]
MENDATRTISKATTKPWNVPVGTLRLVAVRLVAVRLVAVRLVAVRLVAVRLVAVRLVGVRLVAERLVAVRLVAVRLVAVRLVADRRLRFCSGSEGPELWTAPSARLGVGRGSKQLLCGLVPVLMPLTGFNPAAGGREPQDADVHLPARLLIHRSTVWLLPALRHNPSPLPLPPQSCIPAARSDRTTPVRCGGNEPSLLSINPQNPT